MVDYSKEASTYKFNEWVKKALYKWILQYTQVVQSPIANDFLKVSIYGHSETHTVSKYLLQLSVKNFIIVW